MSSNLTEQLAILATIDPADAATGTSTSDVIDMKYWGKVLWIIAGGTVASTGTIDFTVNSGTATGTVTTSVTDITQLTETDDNKQVLVEINDEERSRLNSPKLLTRRAYLDLSGHLPSPPKTRLIPRFRQARPIRTHLSWPFPWQKGNPY